ncbi:MAG: signal peptide peptidase SppA [Aquamicrobium sp.]|nr:signal peptide peptidase SppA [Aquamicrobium sp.]
MTLRADDLIDRRRLRRKLTFWRVAAIAVLLIGLATLSAWYYRGGESTGVDHIAKIKIEGTITQDDELIRRIEAVRKASHVKGVILLVNSPGGTTVGGETIYDAVRKLAAEKPVVTEVGTLAASAGYMIASASDYIVAHQTSIVGSIGVLIQYPDVTGLMDKIGVKLEEVKSSPLKASPSPFAPTTEEARAMVRKLIMDSYDWFVDIVAERRKLPRPQALALADGSIFTGRQAVANKLIDTLGGEQEAVKWLGTKGVDEKLKVVEWKSTERGSLFLPNAMVRQIGRALGLPVESEEVLRQIGADRLFLDGLVSVWHP